MTTQIGFELNRTFDYDLNHKQVGTPTRARAGFRKMGWFNMGWSNMGLTHMAW